MTGLQSPDGPGDGNLDDATSVLEVNQQLVLATLRARAAEDALLKAARDKDELLATLETRVLERTAQLESAVQQLKRANVELGAHSSAMSHDLRVAEASDRLRSMFLATMSHELRTPLNSIIGFNEIVLNEMSGPLNAEQRKQLGIVGASARHLLDLINDVLDVSKMEAGQLGVVFEPFDLTESIERVTTAIRLAAEKKGLSLVADLSPELHEIVSDRRRVEQILINLLGNAVKFTEHGGVTLTVRTVNDWQSPSGDVLQPAVRFQVTDTGIGIRPENAAGIFLPFQRVLNSMGHENEGTGLGLSISRRLASLLAGELTVASEWGQGSTFTLTLPLQDRRPAA